MNVSPPKKHISIRLDPIVYNHVKTKPNASRYIEALIKQDLQYERRDSIYTAITGHLLKDEEYLVKLASKLKNIGGATHVKKTGDDVSIVSGQDIWGA